MSKYLGYDEMTEDQREAMCEDYINFVEHIENEGGDPNYYTHEDYNIDWAFSEVVIRPKPTKFVVEIKAPGPNDQVLSVRGDTSKFTSNRFGDLYYTGVEQWPVVVEVL